nr:hypothetical protein [Maliibacterium massiliense]
MLVFALLLAFVLFGVGSVSQGAREAQLRAAQQAVERACVQHYAIEGYYPANLEVLAGQYGLILERDKFVYHYQALGSNIMPQISVFFK